MLGYNLLLGEERIRNRSPTRNDTPGSVQRPRGRGHGRMRGTGHGRMRGTGRVVDPNIAWNQTYNLPHDRPFGQASHLLDLEIATLRGQKHHQDFFDEMFTDEM